MTDNNTGGWPLGELLANSYKLAVKEAAELKELNAELLAALEELLLGYDEETGTIDVSLEPHCQECTRGLTPAKFDKGPCARHQAYAVIAKAKELDQ